MYDANPERDTKRSVRSGTLFFNAVEALGEKGIWHRDAR